MSERWRFKTVLLLLFVAAAGSYYNERAGVTAFHQPQLILAVRSDASPSVDQAATGKQAATNDTIAKNDAASSHAPKETPAKTSKPAIDLSAFDRVLAGGTKLGEVTVRPRRLNPFATPLNGYQKPRRVYDDAVGVMEGRVRSNMLRNRLQRELETLELQDVVRGQIAVINGEAMYLGDEIGSFQVIGIDPKQRSVTLEALSRIFVLRVKENVVR